MWLIQAMLAHNRMDFPGVSGSYSTSHRMQQMSLAALASPHSGWRKGGTHNAFFALCTSVTSQRRERAEGRDGRRVCSIRFLLACFACGMTVGCIAASSWVLCGQGLCGGAGVRLTHQYVLCRTMHQSRAVPAWRPPVIGRVLFFEVASSQLPSRLRLLLPPRRH
ncbi:hypothetical protein FN846DRAFT_404731 [Sphaerosporella brunnea]|uniref:Uncharacterized protein n=1 Tax=Sphaerosporella brunnea TaxID=1250544 RepID=A0A5J5F554_9PEZI|nr:hypothetical protein FN846DRAFT_404731 [Sphaerosporella brunnea]